MQSRSTCGNPENPRGATLASLFVGSLEGEESQTPLLGPVLYTSNRRQAEDLLLSSKRYQEASMTCFKKVFQLQSRSQLPCGKPRPILTSVT